MRPYDLLVFDWDGTLMDSVHRIVTCMQRAALDAGHPVPDHAAVREIIGLGMHEVVARLWPEAGTREIDDIIEAYRTHWLSDEIPASSLFPGAETVVRWVRETGYLLAVATGKSRRGLDKVLEETSLTDCFDMTRCADEAHSKPHPQMLEDIFTDLHTPPDRVLMIGDSEYDMLMATNAQVDALGIAHGVHETDHLLQSGALAVLDALGSLPVWLNGVYEMRESRG